MITPKTTPEEIITKGMLIILSGPRKEIAVMVKTPISYVESKIEGILDNINKKDFATIKGLLYKEMTSEESTTMKKELEYLRKAIFKSTKINVFFLNEIFKKVEISIYPKP